MTIFGLYFLGTAELGHELPIAQTLSTFYVLIYFGTVFFARTALPNIALGNRVVGLEISSHSFLIQTSASRKSAMP